MSYSDTITETTTFTLTHAKHMAAKVATDLKRIQRLYGRPGDSEIADYEIEVTQLLKAGYLCSVTYGYRRAGLWVEPTLRFTVRDLMGASTDDDDPGRVRPGADITNATFYSYLIYNLAWQHLSDSEKTQFEQSLPVKRKGAPEPGDNGYWHEDRTYSSGGRALDRTSIRSY